MVKYISTYLLKQCWPGQQNWNKTKPGRNGTKRAFQTGLGLGLEKCHCITNMFNTSQIKNEQMSRITDDLIMFGKKEVPRRL